MLVTVIGMWHMAVNTQRQLALKNVCSTVQRQTIKYKPTEKVRRGRVLEEKEKGEGIRGIRVTKVGLGSNFLIC